MIYQCYCDECICDGCCKIWHAFVDLVQFLWSMFSSATSVNPIDNLDSYKWLWVWPFFKIYCLRLVLSWVLFLHISIVFTPADLWVTNWWQISPQKPRNWPQRVGKQKVMSPTCHRCKNMSANVFCISDMSAIKIFVCRHVG